MIDSYKNEINTDDTKTNILLKKDFSPDDVEDLDLLISISTSIAKIHSMYSSSQINDQFFQEIQMLGAEIIKNKSQFIPILINSEIIQILFSIYQNENLSEFKPPVLFCFSDLSALGDPICNIFLQENFIQLFKEHFSFEDNLSNLHLIQIYYNILQNTHQQNIIDQILLILPIRQFFALAHNIEHEQEIICNIFLCLNELMKHTIDDIDDENVIYEIISYYFYEKELCKNESIMVQNVFSRNSLAIIKNRLYFRSFNYELFERYRLFQFLDFYLKNPPIENFAITCDIISLLIVKYQCDYPFDFEEMIRKFILFNSEKNQFSAINSIDCMIKMNPSLCEYFFKDGCSLFFICVDNFPIFNSKTKESLFQLIFDLLSKADSSIWSFIFYSISDEKQNHMSLFSIISEILDYGDYQMKSIILLENIFKCASELNYLTLCYQKFNEAFEDNYKAKFDFIDPETQIFFQTFFSSEC